MKYLMWSSLLLFFLSCFDKVKTEPGKTSDPAKNIKTEINYKANTYKLFIGQEKDSVKKVIGIRRNFELDPDGTDSIQYYIYTGEELIKITKPESTNVLPALYFTFYKGRLKDFECLIDFEPDEPPKELYTTTWMHWCHTSVN